MSLSIYEDKEVNINLCKDNCDDIFSVNIELKTTIFTDNEFFILHLFWHLRGHSGIGILHGS